MKRSFAEPLNELLSSLSVSSLARFICIIRPQSGWLASHASGVLVSADFLLRRSQGSNSSESCCFPLWGPVVEAGNSWAGRGTVAAEGCRLRTRKASKLLRHQSAGLETSAVSNLDDVKRRACRPSFDACFHGPVRFHEVLWGQQRLLIRFGSLASSWQSRVYWKNFYWLGRCWKLLGNDKNYIHKGTRVPRKFGFFETCIFLDKSTEFQGNSARQVSPVKITNFESYFFHAFCSIWMHRNNFPE